jgi:hypothetical protein
LRWSGIESRSELIDGERENDHREG